MKIGNLELSGSHYINGQWIENATKFTVKSPIDNVTLGNCSLGGKDEVNAAVKAARLAFSIWSKKSVHERGEILRRFAQLLRDNRATLSLVESTDNGSLLKVVTARMIDRCAQNIEYFAKEAEGLMALTAPKETNNTDYICYEPAGVAALVIPWNAPLMLATWKLGPALASGNTVVLKPSELAPYSCELLVKLATQAGLPDGVFNVVQGDGSTGQILVEHPDISRISFVGSIHTGKKVAASAAGNLTPVVLELGGKSPLIVFASADLEVASTDIVHQYGNAGQVCLAGTRILVEKSIEESLFAKVSAKIRDLQVGDPREKATFIGPLISQKQFDRVHDFVARAKAEGAEVLLGGGQHAFGELYFEPTLLVPVSQESEIVQNEVFGPVLTWQTFETEEEACVYANDTTYGLAAIVYTLDLAQAMRVGATVSAGTVWVNSFFVRNLAAPFGGFRQSGIGVEGGIHSFNFYCNVKTLSVNEQTFHR